MPKPSCMVACTASFAVVTDEKLQRVDIWVTQGHMFLRFPPDLPQSSQNKHGSITLKLRAFCMKVCITLAHFVFVK